MAVSQVGSATTDTNSFGTSVTMTKPTGVASGDVLVAFITANDQTVTAPSGFTSIETAQGGTGPFRGSSFYKVAGGSEPADYSFSVPSDSPIVGSLSAYRGVDTDTGPIAGSSVSDANTLSEPANTPTVNASHHHNRLLYWRTVRIATTTPVTFTSSSEGVHTTEISDVGIASGTVSYSQAVYLDDDDLAENATQDGIPVTASASESHNVLQTVALASGTAGDVIAFAPFPDGVGDVLFEGEVSETNDGVLAATAPEAAVDFEGQTEPPGVFVPEAPLADASFAGESDARDRVLMIAPEAVASLSGELTVDGSMGATAPWRGVIGTEGARFSGFTDQVAVLLTSAPRARVHLLAREPIDSSRKKLIRPESRTTVVPERARRNSNART